MERLTRYVDLLRLWNPKINLVAPGTLPDVWRRHILDSAQLYPLVPRDCLSALDLGSGAGFPGLVLSILGVPNIRLVESDGRKCAFLREAIRITGATATVAQARAEALPPGPVSLITSRALAPLSALLGLASPFIGPDTVCLFLKGQHVEAELTEAHKMWTMSVQRHPSRSDPAGSVMCLREVRHV